MAAVLAFQGYLRVLKDNGDVCADAKATWYVAGTTTPTDTYTTSALSVANTNPVEANALGVFPEMWLSPTVSYKVVITGTGVTPRTIDSVYGALTINQLENDARYMGVPGGAAYTTTGSSNAYIVSTALSLTSLPAFATFLIKPNFTNTGAATLNVDGLGGKNILLNGAALASGALVSGQIYEVSYDGTQFQITGGGAQPLDATLTALAALSWSASSQVPTFTAADTVSLTTVISGTYTPTATNTTNIAASTPALAQYIRVGSVVTVSGEVSIDPTATGDILLGLTLPIASNIGATSDLSGTAATSNGAGYGAVFGDAANDRASIAGSAPVDATARVWRYTFTYRII